MAKLALTSEVMIQVLFLVMNLEYLLSRTVVFLDLFLGGGAGCALGKPWCGQGSTMHADFRDRSACGAKARGTRIVLLAA